MIHLTLKREYIGVDRQHRLVICPAAVGEHIALQYSRDFKETDICESEGTADLNRKVIVVSVIDPLIKITSKITNS